MKRKVFWKYSWKLSGNSISNTITDFFLVGKWRVKVSENLLLRYIIRYVFYIKRHITLYYILRGKRRSDSDMWAVVWLYSVNNKLFRWNPFVWHWRGCRMCNEFLSIRSHFVLPSQHNYDIQLVCYLWTQFSCLILISTRHDILPTFLKIGHNNFQFVFN